MTDPIIEFRRFNRFHTRLVGALNEHLLASGYSQPQVRVLYEVAHPGVDASVSATGIARELGMDPGYLSRILSGLEQDGLVERTPSPENGKRLDIGLTANGRDLVARLEGVSSAEAGALLAKLDRQDQEALTGAMRKVRRLLGDKADDRTFILREPVPGDLAWVAHRHGVLYARDYGWNDEFEAFVAALVAQFRQNFIAGKERCWIAEREGEVVGSVFIVREDDLTAKLRMLYVEPSARGLGLGRRLVEEAIGFARAAGYTRMKLWTNDILISARRIYEAAGFTMIEEERHHSFGADLVGQVWQRDL